MTGLQEGYILNLVVFASCTGSLHNHCKALSDRLLCTVWSKTLEGRIWLGGTGSPAELSITSGLLVTLCLHLPVSRVQTSRKKEETWMFPFMIYQLCWKCWGLPLCASLVDEKWCSLADMLPSTSLKSSATIQMLPCAEVWLSAQH